MKARKFMKSNLSIIIDEIINDLPNRFDSHEFIRRFAKEFEIDYVTFLSSYKKEPFRKVHAQIAIGLVENMEYFEIRSNGKVLSDNVFGIISENEEWVRI